jgi:hypothetical protein
VRCDEVLRAEGRLVEGYDQVLVRHRAWQRQAAQRPLVSSPSPVVVDAPDPGRDSRYRPTVVVEEPVDPGLVPHWTGMLRALASSHDVLGPRHLHLTARGELALVHTYRLRADAEVRAGLLAVEARWAEFVSWTADNLGDDHEAAYWLGRALALAHQTDQPALVAYMLMRQAQQAADRCDGRQAVALAAAAAGHPQLSRRDRALCAIRMAQGRALVGDGTGSHGAIRHAATLITQAYDRDGFDDPDTIGRHCVSAYVIAHEGYCHLRLGRPRAAVGVLEPVLRHWSPAYRQDEGVTRAWLALAYAACGELEAAAVEGNRALTVATESGSIRIVRTLAPLNGALAGHRHVPGADQYRLRYAMVG